MSHCLGMKLGNRAGLYAAKYFFTFQKVIGGDEIKVSDILMYAPGHSCFWNTFGIKIVYGFRNFDELQGNVRSPQNIRHPYVGNV